MKPNNNYGVFDEKYFVQVDPLEDMLNADKRDLTIRISKLDDWLEERKKILEYNLSRIDEKECQVDTNIYRCIAVTPYDTRPIQGLEKALVDLDTQKRLERTSAFKDMWLVGKEQLELIRQYQQMKRRDSILK